MSMCKKNIAKFHDDHVVLAENLKKTIRERAKNNRIRIRTNLERSENPNPIGFLQQGSYKMGTMIRANKEKYDIDDGIYFKPDELGEMSPREVREMICEAARDKKFDTPPEVKTNCVRIYYNEGFHIDVPVYKKHDNEKPLLSSGYEWIKSDPKAVTEWFKNSADGTGNADGIRKIVRLLKKFVDCYAGESRISGLAISVLVVELWDLESNAEFDWEDALHQIMKSIKDRLLWSQKIMHPVITDECLVDENDQKVIEFKDKLVDAILDLSVLDRHEYSKNDALLAWEKVFPCGFFKDVADNDDSPATKATVAAGVAGYAPTVIANPPKPWSCR
ncbi:cyclic GMP-AMP synthase DncV-like nucleotidyltransferase [Candidatus Spongiihabitans sp.]|uniref:cyclic GMP-AMP synthase DncV-like nucleotidyltransferase n=1 Tax=Candidatus Spongiihabitans sp. TaxID=3101308 RepID=UPI003C7B7400